MRDMALQNVLNACYLTIGGCMVACNLYLIRTLFIDQVRVGYQLTWKFKIVIVGYWLLTVAIFFGFVFIHVYNSNKTLDSRAEITTQIFQIIAYLMYFVIGYYIEKVHN